MYKDIKAEFTGSPEDVLRSINSFLAKQIPALDLANSIMVSYSASDLINMFGDLIRVTPEGPIVWSGELRLSDKDKVALQLVAAKLGYETGKAATPALAATEIQSTTGLNPSSISARLSEMSRDAYVERETAEHGIRYRITTQGIHWLNGILAKKLPRSRSTQ